MGWFSRTWKKIKKKVKNKVLNPLKKKAKKALNVLKKGAKYVGKGASFVGKKLITPAQKLLDTVEKVPLVGGLASAVTGPIKSALATAKNLTDTVGKGASFVQNPTPEGVLKLAGLGSMDPAVRAKYLRNLALKKK